MAEECVVVVFYDYREGDGHMMVYKAGDCTDKDVDEATHIVRELAAGGEPEGTYIAVESTNGMVVVYARGKPADVLANMAMPILIVP